MDLWRNRGAEELLLPQSGILQCRTFLTKANGVPAERKNVIMSETPYVSALHPLTQRLRVAPNRGHELRKHKSGNEG
jgi:hypothetical protein